jgi:lipopolysaccharide export system protein LptA
VKIKISIVKIALLLTSAIFLSTTFSWGQKTPLKLIEGSEDIRLDGKTGNYIVRGNVRLVKDDTKTFCDSAYYNKNNETVRAYGNVHMNKSDSLNLFCDSMFYDMKIEFAKLWGNVRVRDLEYKLTTDSLDFYVKEKRGVYKRNGMVTSSLSDEKLSSVIGYFYTAEKNFFFKDSVTYQKDSIYITTDTLRFNSRLKTAFFYGPTHITQGKTNMFCEKGWFHTEDDEGVLQKNAFIDNPKTYIAGDSLYYSGKKQLYIAKGNVIVLDTNNRSELNGNYAYGNEQEGFSYVTGKALAKNFKTADTLYIHADTLFNYMDSINESRLLLAHRKVKIFKSDMQGVCDSLSYDRHKGEMNLFTNPVLWAKNAQLSSDSMTVWEKDGDIQKAYLRAKPLIITEVDSANYYNQITGKTLTAYFDSTQIRRVDIMGNAKTLYFVEEEKEEDTVIVVNLSGLNRIYASDITLYFEKGDIQAATYRDAPDGVVYPMNKIDKKEERVDGFKWDNSRRPKSWQSLLEGENELLINELAPDELLLPEEMDDSIEHNNSERNKDKGTDAERSRDNPDE